MTYRFCVLLFGLFVSLALATRANANPWQKLLPFKKVDADPNKSYPVTDANGPWMILATVFRGDEAERQAQQLVFELRKKYKLEAYTHVQVFDYTKYGRGMGRQPRRIAERAWQAREDDVKEVAVMVGNFGSLDDDRATETLKKVKAIEPESLRSRSGQSEPGVCRPAPGDEREKEKRPDGQRFCGHQPAFAARVFQLGGSR